MNGGKINVAQEQNPLLEILQWFIVAGVILAVSYWLGGWSAFLIILLITAVAFYFMPTIIAFNRDHSARFAILFINLFFGFTGIAWIACLVWSFSGSSQMSVSQTVIVNSRSGDSVGDHDQRRYEKLAKLSELKKMGAITEAEFQQEKSKIIT